MNKISTAIFVVLFYLFFAPVANAQHELFVSKQTGQFSTYQGQNGKTTDKYESGNVNIVSEGPIQWSVTPNQLNIGPNQTINWTGTLKPDVANAPAAGTSVQAKITGNYNVTFSRPSGGGGDGNVVDTYNCGGCSVHAGDPNATHDIVNKLGSYDVPVTIYSIKVTMDNDPVCSNGSVTLSATPYPGSGDVTWQTPFGQFSGTNVVAAVPAGFAGGPITVTYTVQGVSYSDTRIMPPNTGTLQTFTATQMCVGANTAVPAVTQVTFNGNGCPANNLIYVPLNIGPSAMWEVVDVPLSVTSGAITKNASIKAVNKDKVTTQSFQINFSADPIQNIIDVISGRRCNSGGSLVPNGQFSRATFQECCNTFIKGQTKYEGQMNWSYGINCRFPFYGIPYVATADFLCGASLNASLAINATTQCVGAPQICADFAANGSISGGLGVSLAAGFITADVQVVIEGLGFSGNYCFAPPPMQGKIKGTLGKIKVVGTVTGGWGMASYSVDYVLFQGIDTPEFTF